MASASNLHRRLHRLCTQSYLGVILFGCRLPMLIWYHATNIGASLRLPCFPLLGLVPHALHAIGPFQRYSLTQKNLFLLYNRLRFDREFYFDIWNMDLGWNVVLIFLNFKFLVQINEISAMVKFSVLATQIKGKLGIFCGFSAPALSTNYT